MASQVVLGDCLSYIIRHLLLVTSALLLLPASWDGHGHLAISFEYPF